MTIEDVAYNVKINWNTIQNIEKQYLQEHYSKPFLDVVGKIGATDQDWPEFLDHPKR